MTQSLKVSSKSVPHSVAGALAGILREQDMCEVQVIGAGALNQAIKAVAIARTYLDEDSIDIACVPGFTEVNIDGHSRTAILISVFHCEGAPRPVRRTATVVSDKADGEFVGDIFRPTRVELH